MKGKQMLKWTDVSRDDLEHALAIIKHSYEPDNSLNLIEYFHERMSNGFTYEKDILQELIELVFARIIAGDTADQAFGFKQKRGKYQRKCTVERDTQATACMVLMIRKGCLWLDAIGYAANLLFPDGKGGKAVERAYEYYHEEFEEYSNEVLLDILTPLSLPS